MVDTGLEDLNISFTILPSERTARVFPFDPKDR